MHYETETISIHTMLVPESANNGIYTRDISLRYNILHYFRNSIIDLRSGAKVSHYEGWIEISEEC